MSLLATLKQEIREAFPSPVERDEWRFTRYGLLTATQEMTNGRGTIISRDLMTKAAASQGRDLKIPVMKIGNVTVKNVRSCQIDGLDNETELLTVTWVTLVADISMKKAQYWSNEVDYLQDLDKKLTLVDNAFALATEELIYTKLDTDKSGVYTSPIVGTTYPIVANSLQVAPAQQQLFFNDLESIMNSDDFYSMPFKVMGSTTLQPKIKEYGNQGANNALNTNFQFGNYDFRFSNRVVVGAGNVASGFCMPDGSIGIMTRLAIDSFQGNK